MTFQDIMAFHPKHNNAVYEEIKRNLGQILPFVGAGLTAVVYQSWPAAVTELGKYIASEADQKTLSYILKRGNYLGAAQFLEQKRGKENLRMDMIQYFSRKKLVQNWIALQKEALFVLPLLFPCPVLTTNFDAGIEKVYQHWRGDDFRVLNPNSPSLRQQAVDFRRDACLFKLHGSIDGTMTDYESIVFTKNQYDRHYGLFGDKKAALKAFVNGRSLLFLGCSLDKDKTVDVIRKQAGPGKMHFAIVSCKPGEQDTRLRALSKSHIRAIVYPDGEYSSVRVILEQLLRELFPDKAKLLKDHAAALPKPTENPYVYRARMTPLLGRDEELEKLIQFVTGTDDPFRWWAVTAPGGSGKSKLAMELTDRVSTMDDWTCVTMEAEDYKDLKGFFDRFTRSTLVVVDYVQAHARELGEQMEALSRAGRSHPLRLTTPEGVLAGRSSSMKRFTTRTVCGICAGVPF